MSRQADPSRARRGTGHRPVPAVPNPEPVAALPEPPSDLPPEAQAMFSRVVTELASRGLRDADLEAVSMMCHSAWVHLEARRNVAKYGLVIRGPRGHGIVNPMVKVARDEAVTYLRLANEYGLTYAARLRLGLMQLAGESLLSSLNSELDRRVAITVEAG